MKCSSFRELPPAYNGNLCTSTTYLGTYTFYIFFDKLQVNYEYNHLSEFHSFKDIFMVFLVSQPLTILSKS